MDFYEERPWRRTLDRIKTRCTNPNEKSYKHYGGRGIKCLITAKELEFLWKRDNASKLKKPSIDRINNDGNYEFSNCRFIENLDNVKRARKINSERIKLIRKLHLIDGIGMREIGRRFGYAHSAISRICRNITYQDV